MSEFSPTSRPAESDRHRVVLSDLTADAYKIYATALARVYHTHFSVSQHDWTYAGIKGILAFGRDRNARGSVDSGVGLSSVDADKFWFRLVDETGKVVWQIKVPKPLDYQVDKPFFHFFPGRSRMFGFRFEDDGEAKTLSKEVTSRIGSNAFNATHKKSKSLPAQATHLSTSMISSPRAFVHVAHVGFNEKGVVEASEGLNPMWATLVGELKGHGVPYAIIQKDREYVEGFLEGAKAAKKSSEGGARE